MTYQTIAMDPPWPETGGGRIKRGADRHYQVVSHKDMPLVVLEQPGWRPDKSGCLVFCWTTVSSSERAYWLLRCLGVEPVSKLYWLKDRSFVSACVRGCGRKAPGIARVCGGCGGEHVELRGRLGLGQYTRHDIEEVVVGKIGTFGVPRLKRRSWVLAKPGRHSEKPTEMYDLFELMADGCGLDGPRSELFARDSRAGWEVSGNEATKGDK